MDLRVETIHLITEFKPNVDIIRWVKEKLNTELLLRKDPTLPNLELLLKEVQTLTGEIYPLEDAQLLIKNLYTPNPILEILNILSRIGKVPCQNLIVLVLYYKSIPLGIVSLILDDNLVYGDDYSPWGIPRLASYKKIGYFIGITKFASWSFAQSKGWLKEIKLNSVFIPRIIVLAKESGCVYVGCTPLSSQDKILRKHYGFIPAKGEIYSKNKRFIVSLAIDLRESHLIRVL